MINWTERFSGVDVNGSLLVIPSEVAKLRAAFNYRLRQAEITWNPFGSNIRFPYQIIEVGDITYLVNVQTIVNGQPCIAKEISRVQGDSRQRAVWHSLIKARLSVARSTSCGVCGGITNYILFNRTPYSTEFAGLCTGHDRFPSIGSMGLRIPHSVKLPARPAPRTAKKLYPKDLFSLAS